MAQPTGGIGEGTGPIPLPGSVTYTPDYQALIQNDPAYQAIADAVSGQDISSAAQRQAATDQALAQFGAVPDFSSLASSLGLSPEALAMLQADVNPNVAALAQANTQSGLSTEAQLQQQQQMGLLSLRNALAARGALSSGDDAYRTNLQNQSYAKAQQDALNALLQAINGYQSTYLNEHNAGQDKLNAARTDAMNFEASLPQNQGFQLHYDPKTGTYKDATGGSYTVKANGNGSWTLTNSATGSTYTLSSDGTLTPYTAPTGTGGGTGNGTGNGTGGDGSGFPAPPGHINTGFGHVPGSFPTSSPPIYTGPGAGGRNPGTFYPLPGPINTGFGQSPNPPTLLGQPIPMGHIPSHLPPHNNMPGAAAHLPPPAPLPTPAV